MLYWNICVSHVHFRVWQWLDSVSVSLKQVVDGLEYEWSLLKQVVRINLPNPQQISTQRQLLQRTILGDYISDLRIDEQRVPYLIPHLIHGIRSPSTNPAFGWHSLEIWRPARSEHVATERQHLLHDRGETNKGVARGRHVARRRKRRAWNRVFEWSIVSANPDHSQNFVGFLCVTTVWCMHQIAFRHYPLRSKKN